MKYFLTLIICLILIYGQVLAFDASRCLIFDMPEEDMIRNFDKSAGSLLTEADLEAIRDYQFAGDTFKVLIIPVEWTNRPGTWPVETLDSMMFLENDYSRGSLADYFKEMSYGAITVTGTVLDWYNAGSYDNSGYFDFTPIMYALDATVDYSEYDGDNDGNVDAVIFLRSGTGEEYSGDPTDIWSYAMVWQLGYGEGPFDGKLVPRWSTSPELKPLFFPDIPSLIIGDTLNNVGVFCHELTHNMGLPDLYDYDSKLETSTYYTPNDDNDHPMMDWCLMGYNGYSIFSHSSPTSKLLCGWGKRELGWITADTLTGENHDVVIYDINTHKDSSLYLLPISSEKGEYFLLEYRNPYSSSKFGHLDSDYSPYFHPDLTFGPDTLDRGLMITHVQDSAAPFWDINEGTPDFDNYGVAIEDAGYNPSRDMYSNPESRLTDSANWWYPYETRLGALFSDDVPGQESFTPNTVPNSDSYEGPTGISVHVDSIADDKLYCYVNVPLRPAEWDAVSTPCVNLIVGSNGNFGKQGQAGYGMDFSNSGDCDVTATTYLYDASPVISFNNGSEDVLYNAMYENESYLLHYDEILPVATQQTENYQIYETGTMVTPDSAIAIEKTYWAPNSLDSCHFIVQRLKVYSFDGQAHTGLHISEAVDWDIPTDDGSNYGGYEEDDRLLYARGCEFNGEGCQRNDARYGGQAMLGYYINDMETYDNTAGPYSGKALSFNTYVYPYEGLDATVINGLIEKAGYEILGSGDKVYIMTFFYDYDLAAEDTLNIMSALITIMNDTLAVHKVSNSELQANVYAALEWSNVHLFGMEPTLPYICGDANGDETVNIADASFIVNAIFFGGAQPDPEESADANDDGSMNIADASYLVNWIFFGGNAPCE